jgi:DNA invertase Pin-like site-specific DNA recombinase
MNKRKVLALIRVSTAKQAKDEKGGIPRQLEDISIHCQTHNLVIAEEFRLEGISGASVEKSPDFRRMLKHLEDPSITGVVFATLDRFFRPDKLSQYSIFKTFEKYSKHLFCDLGELNTADSNDQLKLAMYGSMAGMERKRIYERTQRGKQLIRKQNNRNIDPLPHTIRFIPDSPNSKTGTFEYTADAQRVKKAFELVLAGTNLSETARQCGFKLGSVLRKHLKCYWYIGCRAINKHHVGQCYREDGSYYQGKRVDLENPEFIETNLTTKPLVSRETFFTVQYMLDGNTKAWISTKSRANDFLGTGITYCECGHKMYCQTDKRFTDKRFYVCSSKYNHNTKCQFGMIKAQTVDSEIYMWIVAKMLNRSFLKGIQPSTTERDLKSIQKNINTLENKVSRCIDLAADLDRIEDRARNTKNILVYREQITSLQAELNAPVKSQSLNVDELYHKYLNFDKMDILEQKELLRKTFKAIHLDSEGHIIRIEWAVN